MFEWPRRLVGRRSACETIVLEEQNMTLLVVALVHTVCLGRAADRFLSI